MTEHDNAYAGLIEADDDSRWAFGTGFEDPLAGVDTTLPAGVHGPDLAAYCLMLGDDALVMSHRLSEWCTRAPELEEEVALANIALDLLGQTRVLLARAAAADPGCAPTLPAGSPIPPEDALAFFRADTEFRCVRLVEPPNGDFAESMARLLVFSTWRLALLEDLRSSADPVLAAIADKGVKEVSYHREYAARWVVTLGLGTPESARRMQDGLGSVWRYLDELFDVHPIEKSLASKDIAAGSVEQDVRRTLAEVLQMAGLELPEVTSIGPFAGRAGRDGFHTESLSRLLSEMQSVARAHPEGLW
jgi:ring-1,2-phenylacetyl-CoA epoxidase subunit PaaC